MRMIAFGAALFAASQASAAVYECKTTSFGNGGWVPPLIIVSLNGKAGAVYDYFVDQTHGKPIAVKVEQRSDQKYVLRWKLFGPKARNGGKSHLTYRMNVNTRTGRFNLNGILRGYDNNIHGAGKCVPAKKK